MVDAIGEIAPSSLFSQGVDRIILVYQNSWLLLALVPWLGWSCGPAPEPSLCAGQVPSGSSIRIASADEPGERMEISGQVWLGKRRIPLARTRIIVYHTNAEGRYAKDGSGYPGAYLCGVLSTDSDGRYRIETIRPAPRSDGPSAHIHFELTVPWGVKYHDAVGFFGDPRLGNVRAGESWEEVRPVVIGDDGVQHVEKDFWIRY